MKPIKIINLLGFAGFKGTVAGWTTVYTQVSQQLQMARAKVQEITPVYTVVQPATVPLKPAKPNKLMILIGFMFLAGVGSVGWILFVKDLLKGWKKQTI
jgi:uncharacterized protein involved in exopolysaccharide biosynthesis